jgi:kinesin family protein 4/21/27
VVKTPQPSLHSRQLSLASRRSHKDVILETDEVDDDDEPLSTPNSEDARRTATEGPVDHGEPIEPKAKSMKPLETKSLETSTSQYPPQSPAQSKFVEDKLENVTQELFDLRVEHESTINEFDLLSAKYEEALRTLAELQDYVDESRHPGHRDSILSISSPIQTRPTSFLADARVQELKDGGHFSSSRLLSSDLSSDGELPGPMEHTDAEPVNMKLESSDETKEIAIDETIALEVEELRKLAAEKELLAEKYAQLEEQHMDALDLVEELKAEVSKAKMVEVSSPRSTTPVIRRKSSQNIMVIDKAQRAFASLRNIAIENFETDPDTLASFELNVNTAMHELHARSERSRELETELSSVKKEMETKMTIISGLTRERSSMKSSPMDMSVVSTMRDQLLQSENQMRMLQESHTAREQDLLAELEALRSAISDHPSAASNGERALGETDAANAVQEKKIADLEAELSSWEDRHATALKSMESSEQHLLATIAELERQVQSIGEDKTRSVAAETDGVISNLQTEITEQKAIVAANAARVSELEQSHAATREQLEAVTKVRDAAALETEQHKSLIARLEQQILEHGSIVKAHQDDLAVLKTSHTKALDDVKASAQADQEARLAELTKEHQEHVRTLQSELDAARNDLTKIATQVALALGVDVSTDKLQDRISDLAADQKALADETKKSAEMEVHVMELSTINDTIMGELEAVKAELAALLAETAEGTRLDDEHATVAEQLAALKKEMQDLETKNKKNSRLVEELEDQLNLNFDQHQIANKIANNRLSTLQTERNVQVEEANAAHARVQSELEAIREEYANLQVSFEVATYINHPLTLQAKLDEVQQTEPGTKRANSTSSHLRKSASVASLPSPPPAIPLPPLPGAIAITSPTIPPTPTQGNRPSSKDLASSQIQEDQEARIRTIEKHLIAEKRLTTTLEEALTDLERQSNKMKAECDAWRRRAGELEKELKEAVEREKNGSLDKENRWSMLQVEEERKKRRDAEIARAHLEERMNAISKKKKKGSLNCF